MAPILGIYASQISGHLFAPSGAYDSIATTIGTGSSSTITFSSIPSTYTHLQLRYTGRSDRSGITTDLFLCRFNSDTGSNYMEYHRLLGDGSTASAGAGSASSTNIIMGAMPGASALATTVGVGVVDILDYANSNKYKTTRNLMGNDYNGSGNIQLFSGLWMSTSAINTITLTTSTGSNWTTATQFALYGIKGGN
jgi:hypothetical protein